MTQPEKPINRRKFLRLSMEGILATALVGGVGAVGAIAVKGGYEGWEDQHGKEHAEKLFRNGIKSDWHKFAIGEVLLQADPGVEVSSGMFDKPSTGFFDSTNFNLILRPFNVRQTLLRNIADYSAGTRSQVDRGIYKVPNSLFAFVHPDNGEPVYFDAAKNAGLLLPLVGVASGNSISVGPLDISGRELSKGVPYLYAHDTSVTYTANPDYSATFDPRQDIPHAKDDYYFLGQYLTAKSTADLDTIVYNMVQGGTDPMQFPAP